MTELIGSYECKRCGSMVQSGKECGCKNKRSNNMAKEDGGQAFPKIDNIDYKDTQRAIVNTIGGLTKREWFAGMALQGILANPIVEQYLNNREKAGAQTEKQSTEATVKAGFYYADAMIAESKKE